jgi:hypothetical protein
MPFLCLELYRLRSCVTEQFARPIQVFVDASARIATKSFALIAMLFAILTFTHDTSHNPIPKNSIDSELLKLFALKRWESRPMPAQSILQADACSKYFAGGCLLN